MFNFKSISSSSKEGIKLRQDNNQEINRKIVENTKDEICEGQTNVNSDIPMKLPKQFIKFFNFVINNVAKRGNLNEDEWQQEIKNKDIIEKNVKALEANCFTLLEKIDLKLGPDFINVSEYSNGGGDDDKNWYTSQDGFGNLIELLRNNLLRLYTLDKTLTSYAGSVRIKEILDHFVKQVNIKLKFPPENFKFPWGNNWYQFSVTYPQFLAIWILVKHSYELPNTKNTDKYVITTNGNAVNYSTLVKLDYQEDLIDQTTYNSLINKNKNPKIVTRKFRFMLKDQDVVDQAALNFFTNYYTYPVIDVDKDVETGMLCGEDGCGIKSMGWLRQGSNCILMGLPWVIGKIFSTLLIQPAKMTDLLYSFRLADDYDGLKKQEKIPQDYILRYIRKQTKVKYATLFDDQGIFNDGSFIYHETVTAYGYLTSSYTENTTLNFLLDNINDDTAYEDDYDKNKKYSIIEKYHHDDGIKTVKKSNIDRIIEKYIFSKLEHHMFNRHWNSLFSRTTNKNSSFYYLGQIGAFAMHRIGVCAYKRPNFSLVYRLQRPEIAFYESDKSNDRLWESWVLLRQIVDKYSDKALNIEALGYENGIVRVEKDVYPYFPTKTTTTTDWLPNKNLNNNLKISHIAHLNDGLSKSILCSMQAYVIDDVNGFAYSSVTKKPVTFKLLTVEFTLCTPAAIHINRRNVYIYDNKEYNTLILGIGHTYNTGIRQDRVRIVQQQKSIQIGLNYIIINSGSKGDFVITKYKNTNGIEQQGVTLEVDANNYSYTIMRLDTEDKELMPDNELINDISLQTGDINNEELTLKQPEKVNAKFETFNWTAIYRNNLIMVYDKLNGTMILSKYFEGEQDGTIPSYFSMKRNLLRSEIGDERINGYNVRSSTDAQHWKNYDNVKEQEIAKIDLANLDKPEASIEASNVNYLISIQTNERFKNISMDNLSCKAKLQEYMRGNYAIRIDNLKKFN